MTLNKKICELLDNDFGYDNQSLADKIEKLFLSQKEQENNESCAGCRFYNSCGLRIDYDNVRCPDFLS